MRVYALLLGILFTLGTATPPRSPYPLWEPAGPRRHNRRPRSPLTVPSMACGTAGYSIP